MRKHLTLPVLCLLGACAAPEIADWPPEAPAVPEATVQRYVDVYGAEPDVPIYGPDDVDALNLLTRRVLRNDEPDSDIERLRDELDTIRGRLAREPSEPKAYSKNHINAIKRRVSRKYESHHDQRMELKRYGL
ncbi:hypothetical protein L2D14_10395 [Thalassospiraceae bacterium LMO-JJ14]|nr:hypothetical protein L2D14_10395 [Thalassospiraceae bacterium LMO-JJ14]